MSAKFTNYSLHRQSQQSRSRRRTERRVMNSKVEFVTAVRPRTLKAVEYARKAEEAGWHGIGFLDNQNLCGDIYVSLALAASATERIHLSTDVTNPVTRHPAVTAGAISSIQEVSEGRAVLGIGRGDSALAFVGHAPAYVSLLESYLKALQGFLSGGSVPFDELTHWRRDMAPHVDTLNLLDTPDDSRLRWLDPQGKKVPVSVAASGPRVISTAARHADIVMFALGAGLGRLEWGLEQARSARREAGLDPDGIRYGAYLNVVCHPQLAVARELVQFLPTFVRFSAMQGKASGPVTQTEREVLERLNKEYKMWDRSAPLDSPAEFVDQFAIVGPPERCITRIQEIIDLGIERIVVMGLTVDETDDEKMRCSELMAKEVLPVFSGSEG
jgi:5,10-methylenetetrahydromethanopterin reductase